MIDSRGKNKKDLNFELNLLPVFDILSVCICFLLMTAVWVQVGSMNASQSMGGQKAEKKNPPTVWAYMNPGGQVTLNFKDVPRTVKGSKSMSFPGVKGQINWAAVISAIGSLEKQVPDMRTALIMPSTKIEYADIIQLMDQMKKLGIKDVGITPL